MPKAIVLPINILVIVAIATVTTIGMVGIYGTGFNPFSTSINLESVKNVACRKLVFGGCKAGTNEISVSYDANKNKVNDTGSNWNWATGTGDDNLAALCYNFFGRRDEKSCKQLCGCGGGMTSGGGGGGGPSCSCGAWANGACGAGGCAANQRQQTRTCTPGGCQPESQCINDPLCGGAPCACSDGTSCNSCAWTDPFKPSWCDGFENWVPNQCQPPHGCSCPLGQTCQGDGSCAVVSSGCQWLISFCASDPACIFCCTDAFTNPLYELVCGPPGCSGGVCVEGARMCSTTIC